MKLDRATLEAMSAAKIDFVSGVSAPWGGITVVLGVDDIAPFLADRAEWFAKKNGAFKSQYEDWLATSGEPRCGALTTKGERCKNFVSGGIQREFEVWLQEDGGFCTVHGGDGSRKGKKAKG